ncbi:Two component integral membrane sensor signal transduction histidine kinase [Modestobacter italicus]|uniref:histidine kinase n=1 Tax=Modestobacter italicus (strain DSM 44449 / CECT 9708 / BC 501) TaxID=2732864 RepID=I4F1V7_MODI5|nr:sensor histidine kinase [Modestobacter marinus]CCH89620.1 Two component integral membrane sensor signal transduction histidine kinase [Modestobacter marinus]
MTRLPSLPPRVLDVVAAAACVAAMGVELARSTKAEPSVAAVVAIVVASLPVLLRRDRPVLAMVLAMTTLLGVTTTAEIYQTIPIPAVLCAYALADRLGRTAALWTGAATAPVVVAILLTYSQHSILDWDTARNLGWVALPLALGVAAHDRRAATAALVDRAESAERNREEEALRRVGEERLRIARDVHDVVAHAMVAINVQAGVGAHLLDRDPEQARATLRDIKRVSGEALGDLRSMLGLLREDEHDSPVRPVQGLAGIDDLRDGLGSAGIDLDVRIDPDVSTLPVAVGATGYRIVQEALTNVLRHAGPTSARVHVSRAADVVLIEVEDDGGAAPPALDGTGSGSGLRGMRERAAAAGGSLEAGPRPGGGWRVAASLPVSVPVSTP